MPPVRGHRRSSRQPPRLITPHPVKKSSRRGRGSVRGRGKGRGRGSSSSRGSHKIRTGAGRPRKVLPPLPLPLPLPLPPLIGRSFKTSCKRLKMEKTPRYTQRERNMVLGYAAQYKEVIENKRTDAESNRKKDEVWLQIAKEFNSQVYHQRSAKQLRQLYKNMKLLLKKDLCGEDKTNGTFLDLLNTLSQQESVAQFMATQMSPDGGNQSGGANGHHQDDYEDSKVGWHLGSDLYNHLRQQVTDQLMLQQMPPYDMDTDVVLIKSETISDNDQTENGMDCLDDDDDDDCPSPKAPEVCLEEEDDVLFATDLSQLQQGSAGSAGGGVGSGIGACSSSSMSLPGGLASLNGPLNGLSDAVQRSASSPVCSTKTSVSSSGSYVSSTPKPDITIQTVGHIRVGSFANINKTLHNGSATPNANNSNGNGNSSSNSAGVQHLTAEQVQQHMLLNGLGLSAVNPPPQTLQAAINAATASVPASGTIGGTGFGGNRRTPPTLQLPRLQRGNNNTNNINNNNNNNNNHNHNPSLGSGTANGVQLLLNGHHNQHGRDKATQGVAIGAAGSFNGYNGLAVTVPCLNSSSSSANSSGGMLMSSSNGGSGNGTGPRMQHQEFMMSLAIEERKRKIDLLNAQIDYWQTLTKKLGAQPGHFPNPACLCHFPGSAALGHVAGVTSSASSSSSAGVLQTQTSSS
ncbi:rho GTPase-activating protein gacZ isoform X1 [Drosophila miranda]|uniref:rho GTPase-activating protein gacZ isoform X1 n=2 Tax=Drosophila miranda TaxID=7229 RepID=UPI0007E70BE7|nr:rho GTPase-activating protein gacZ isoform X1 [Drosophila miranda]